MLSESTWDAERQETVEQLFQQIASVVTLLPQQVDLEQMLLQDSGSISIPEGGCSSPKLLNGIQWQGVSLHWVWQHETQSCCLNFLAQRADLGAFGSIEHAQWTLEASCQQTKTKGNEETECRRAQVLEPTPRTSWTAIQTFWKLNRLRLLCVEFQDITLMGSFSSFQQQQQPPQQGIRLDPKAFFTCNKVALAGPLPQTSHEHVQIAKLVSLLDPWHSPSLQWKAAPVPHLESTLMNTLGDVFRHVYTFLDDLETQRVKEEQQASSVKEQAPTTSGRLFGRMRNGTNQEEPIKKGGMNEATATTNASDSRGGLFNKNQSSSRINVKQSIGDSLAMTAGCVATGASFITPVGAAVSVAAMGVKDGVVAAAKKGQASRNAESYRPGDSIRGVVATIQEKRRQRQRQGEQEQETDGETAPTQASSTGSREGSSDQQNGYVDANKGRFAGVLGSSVGAATGLALLGGPIGLMAGSLVGGHATQAAVRENRNSTTTVSDGDEEILRQLDRGAANGQVLDEMEKKPFRFGDNVRGMVAKGKQSSGRDEDSSYQFGDFSRGLFSRK